ncbi:non-ribosomal peptide synthetase [uncultured Paludibaculum sp.]|uniref:non-ribosomal peptide synthetase n=1 Tax=uncultured Paludibaculum sp. TaxID=1765020 RepID=UPI002AABC189|nr:non-ribosomal peptide synthetase [uncultured Paludibaculum sp.]
MTIAAPLQRAIEDILPLSPLQQGLLFHALFDSDGPDVYTVQIVFQLEGRLSEDNLRAAIDTLVRRHANLRASFRHEALSQPVQVIARRIAVPWKRIDLSGLPAEEAGRRLSEFLAQDRRRRFVVSKPPLMRFTLIRLTPEKHSLAFTHHHILIDGWSTPILMRELLTLYARKGDDAGLPRPVPYRDYLAWLSRQDQAAARAAWTAALRGVEEPTRLAPAANGAIRSFPERVTIDLPPTLTAALTRQARAHGLTLNTLVQGAWGVLLGRLTGRDDVVFGVTVAGRPPEIRGIESMIGLFINTLPLRVRWSSSDRLSDLFARVQDAQTVLLSYQYASLSDVQRTAGVGELFDTLVIFENYLVEGSGSRAACNNDLQVRSFGESDATHYPLTLLAAPGKRLHLRLVYRPDVFNAPEVRQILTYLVRLLESIAVGLDRPVASLSLLSDAERSETLEAWNATGRALEPTVWPELFERQVEQTPDAVALVFEDTRLTYSELNEQANRIAHLLLAKGIGPEDIVAVALPRSVELVECLLGILKAGAAYLPLDRDYPGERLRLMLEDACPAAVLANSDITAHLPRNVGRLVLDHPEIIDALPYSANRQVPRSTALVILEHPDTVSVLADCPTHNPSDLDRRAALRPEHPAYVIYTSGSTGQPKGVVVHHAGLVNRLKWMQNEYGLTAVDRVLQKTPSGFDVSVWEFFWPLSVGAALVVAKPGGHRDPAYLIDLIDRENVTTIHFVPSMLRVFLQETAPKTCESLRRVICSGEALPGDVQAEFFGKLTSDLHNLYGPTEATVDVTYWACRREDGATSVPIGRPIWNTQVYVLDGNLQPAPVGVAGELYLAGVGLARGYLKRPGLTTERFVANPYGGPGARMYRTGDLVRWRADGALEYLGRTDHQVKIRGFRVELGEIEAELLKQPGVRQAAVIAREDEPGQKRLAAYVVPGDGYNLESVSLRQALSATLPDFMVPSAFVPMETLPLTPNGKLDRKILPIPELTGAELRAPRNPEEEILCTIFAEILGLPGVGMDDHFFDLGGDSLLGARLTGRIRATLNVSLSVRDLFESPTVAQLAERLRNPQAPRPPLQARERPSKLPLSFAQQRLWFLNRLEAHSTAYNIPLALGLKGQLDRAALETALADVVARHEALRTVFPDDLGVPRQQIVEPAQARPVLHATRTTQADLEAELTLASRVGFDIGREIPIRAHLYVLGPDDHVLLLLLHHIAGDGWSLGPLTADLARAYAARRRGIEPQLPKLPVQYADYTLWQREAMGEESDPESAVGRQLAFWTTTLQDLPEQLLLPADRPRPAVASYRGDAAPFRIDAELHAVLVKLSRESQASLFMVMQAAVAALLTRLGAGADISIGSPVAGRTDNVLEAAIGFFVNTLVLRTDTSGNPSFRELLSRVRAADLNAYANQDLPFERIVEALNPSRSLSRHPLFQVMLAFQKAPYGTLRMPGLKTTVQRVPLGVSEFDLTFRMSDYRLANGAPGGMEGYLEFSTDLFDRATAERIVGGLVRLLQAVAANPEQRLGGIKVMADEELRNFLKWNDTRHEVPRALVHELFERQVERTPSATAVVFEGIRLSYAELNQRCNRLARLLLAKGVRPGDVVAMAAPRSVEMMVALIGILKAGAAYLPVDPEYPPERLSLMLADAEPAAVIATASVASSLPPDTAVLVLDAPETVTELSRYGAENLTAAERELRSEHPAYVIYTSGSTGQPKGVVVQHTGLVNRLKWMQHEYGLTADDRVLQKTPSSFDVSVWEFFWPLIEGAALVVARPGGHREAGYLVDLIRREGVTTLHFVPSMLQAFLQEPGVEMCDRLRKVICSGEALPSEVQAEFFRKLNAGLHNLYGPTEATVDVTYWACRQEDGSSSVPIGRPIWNTRVYVLDESLQPVPVGVAGELYIEGIGLARGYLKRPGLTAERFVANPYGAPGARMYRTGDLAKWRADGAIEYLGRTDQQIKIRGFRVELGEIEAVLLKDPEVVQAVVVAREDEPGQKRLVGYVTPVDVDTASLRQRLAQTLPEYMVPAAIVTMEALPLTPNGKLDRKALPAPEFRPIEWRAPRTPQEEVLCSLFAETLRLEKVGLDDNFFHLGGHSLLATRLIGRLRVVLDADLSVRDLFEAPTVAELAQKLHTAFTARVRLRRMERPAEIPLSFAQQRLWFLCRLEGISATYNIPLALRLCGQLDPTALEAAMADVVERHESLRTVLPESTSTPRQHVLPPDAAGPKLRVVVSSPDSLAQDLAVAAGVGFEISREIPLRVHLFVLGPEEHVLLLLLHHIAGDGWSLGPLAVDLAAAYAARTRGVHPRFPELPVQYADYALWQREVMGEENDRDSIMGRQLAFWVQTLQGLPDQLDLPSDRTRPAMASYRGGTVPFHIDAALHCALLNLARDTQATLFMVMQAAIAALLTRLGAGTDIPIGSPIAGRTDPALEGLIGFFVNTLVLRTDTSGSPSFRQLIARVREADLNAYANQDVPFERLVEALNPMRSLSRHPLFQVMLAFQNASRGRLNFPGLDVTSEAVETGVAKFDLSFSIADQRTPYGSANGLNGSIEYSADLFERSTVERMTEWLTRLIAGVVADPDRSIDSIDLPGPVERKRLLIEWNATDRAVPQLTLPALFEQAVAHHTDAIAVVCGEKRMTFAQLNEKANRLAHALISKNVGPEDLVGLRCARSADAIAAVLGVLKSGAAYLPLDPAYPLERLAFMQEDSRPALVLDDADVGADMQGTAANPTDADRNSPLLLSHPAYVIYTSGSTGRPKGVVVTHAGLSSLIASQSERFGVTPAARVLQFASMSFDAAVSELFATLVSGATLVIPTEQKLLGEELFKFIQQQEVTHVTLPPSVLSALPSKPLPLETLVLAGEPCSSRLVSRWSTGRRLINAYGPTETTVCATMSAPLLRGIEAPPIGQPIANTQAYVLGAGLSLVPVGVPGELYVSGLGLARGYFRKPALTSERFVANPFGSPGSRMYRTGDIARWCSDGNLYILGRKDRQMKIRGARVELGEVEGTLTRQPGIADAAVVLREDADGDRRLIGFVVPADGAVIDAQEVRRQSALALPEYMTPAAIVVIPALPLTPSQKLDYRALPDPEFASASAWRGPRTHLEEILCSMFSETLGVPRLGVDDNFWDLGGNSYLAVRLSDRISAALGVQVRVGSLWEAPTVARLADKLNAESPQDIHGLAILRLMRKKAASPFATLLPLRSEGRQTPFFFVHSVDGLSWSYARLLPYIEDGHPVYGLQARRLEDVGYRAESIDEVAEDYAAEIVKIQPCGPYHLLGWSAGGVLAYALAARLQQNGHEVALLAMLDTHAPRLDSRPATDEGTLAYLHRAFTGYEVGGMSSFEMVDELKAILRGGGGTLASLSEDELDAVVAVEVDVCRLTTSAGTLRYKGDLIFLSAERDPGDKAPHPGSWAAYVDGDIRVVGIPCTHLEMMQPGPSAQIGYTLTSELSKLPHWRKEP